MDEDLDDPQRKYYLVKVYYKDDTISDNTFESVFAAEKFAFDKFNDMLTKDIEILFINVKTRMFKR